MQKQTIGEEVEQLLEAVVEGIQKVVDKDFKAKVDDRNRHKNALNIAQREVNNSRWI